MSIVRYQLDSSTLVEKRKVSFVKNGNLFSDGIGRNLVYFCSILERRLYWTRLGLFHTISNIYHGWVRFLAAFPPISNDFLVINWSITKQGSKFGIEIVNFINASLIREPRPANLLKDGSYGMPSSHSQFIAFFCTFGSLYVNRFGGPDKLRGWEMAIHLAFLVAAVLVPYSRVYLNYHNWSQVLMGCIVGTTAGIIWYYTLPVLEIIWPHLSTSFLNTILQFSFRPQKENRKSK